MMTLSPVKTIPSQDTLNESADIMRYKFVIRGPNDVTCTMYRNRADLVRLHEILCERKITAQLSMLRLPKSFTNKLTAGITKTGFNESQEYFVLAMKLNGNAVKPGNVIEHNGRLWTAVKVAHVKPGKGGAFAQIELRDIRDGTKLNERFRSSETVERVILDEAACTFLYDEGDHLVFMHSETFEQISIIKDMVGERAAYLQDGMVVTMSSHEGDPISVELPDTVVMEVVEADAVVKGQTASSSYKPAILENGERVMVPPHIESGTRIVVRPEDASYVERAKN